MIEALISKELERANTIHRDYFASAHEGESVLREEVEEAIDNIDMMTVAQERLWSAIKNNDSQSITFYVRETRKYAKEAIRELVEVAAMCDKFVASVRGDDHE